MESGHLVIFSTSGKFITKFNVLRCISLSETLFWTGARGRIPIILIALSAFLSSSTYFLVVIAASNNLYFQCSEFVFCLVFKISKIFENVERSFCVLGH